MCGRLCLIAGRVARAAVWLGVTGVLASDYRTLRAVLEIWNRIGGPGAVSESEPPSVAPRWVGFSAGESTFACGFPARLAERR